MVSIRLFIFAILFSGSIAQAASSRGSFGVNAGFGIPYVGQLGVNTYLTENLGIDVGFNALTLTSGQAKLSLVMPEVLLKWHPFGGAFFIAGGLGQETLTAKSENSNGDFAEIKVTALTAIGKLGWMWFAHDGGFWFGADLSFINPMSPNSKVSTNVSPTDQDYTDALNVANKFGEKSYLNITIIRLGYLF